MNSDQSTLADAASLRLGDRVRVLAGPSIADEDAGKEGIVCQLGDGQVMIAVTEHAWYGLDALQFLEHCPEPVLPRVNPPVTDKPAGDPRSPGDGGSAVEPYSYAADPQGGAHLCSNDAEPSEPTPEALEAARRRLIARGIIKPQRTNEARNRHPNLDDCDAGSCQTCILYGSQIDQHTNEALAKAFDERSRIAPNHSASAAWEDAATMVRRWPNELDAELRGAGLTPEEIEEIKRRRQRTDSPLTTTTDQAHRDACDILSALGVFSPVRVEKLAKMLRARQGAG